MNLIIRLLNRDIEEISEALSYFINYYAQGEIIKSEIAADVKAVFDASEPLTCNEVALLVTALDFNLSSTELVSTLRRVATAYFDCGVSTLQIVPEDDHVLRNEQNV